MFWHFLLQISFCWTKITFQLIEYELKVNQISGSNAFPDTICIKIRAKYNFIADKIEIHKGSNIIRFYYTTFWMFWFHILIHFNLSIVHYFFQHSSHSIYRNTYGRSPAWHHCSKALKYWSFVTNYQSKLSTFTFGGLLLFPHNFLFLPPCRLGHVIWNSIVPLIVSHL